MIQEYGKHKLRAGSFQGPGSGRQLGNVFGLWGLLFGKLLLDILRWLSGVEAWELVFGEI